MQDTSTNCLTVGLNAAWQTVLSFDRLTIGDVNRARAKHGCPAGKAVNAARALRIDGLRPTVAQVAGGPTGRTICAELERDGVPHITVETSAETRTATTVIDDAGQTVTELIEPSGTVSGAEVSAFLDRVGAALPGFDGVALCGTWPPGVPASVYADIARAARGRSVVLLDAWRDVAETLAVGVDILKVNAAEITTFTGIPDTVAAARHCIERFDVGFIVVTAGAKATSVISRTGAWKLSLPPLDTVRNPIGAGDCVTGILLARTSAVHRCRRTATGTALASVLADHEMVDAVADALAVGSASCLELLPAYFDPLAAARLRAGLTAVQV